MKRFYIIFGFSMLCLLIILSGRYAYIKSKYPVILENIESTRNEFAGSYKSAKTHQEKEKIIDQASYYLNEILPNKLFPAWYGTPWSFNGDANHPFHGTIACGSFVEIVLKHAGFVIDSRMSAQPSEYIIKNICENKTIVRFSNVPIASFNNEVQNLGDGIYIVGLDSHVGFLYVLKGKYRFVHSHGYLFVLSEIPSLSPILRMSKYRVVGKLFNNKMIEQWLNGKKILLKHNYFEQNR